MIKIPGKVLFRTIVGSKAYGIDTPESDTDKKGVYIQTPNSIILDGYRPNYRESKDIEYYEIRRFLELVESGNITVLEMLFTDDEFIEVLDDSFAPIREQRHKFLSKKMGRSIEGFLTNILGDVVIPEDEKQGVPFKTPLHFCTVITVELQIELPFFDFINVKRDPASKNPDNYSLFETLIPNTYFMSYYLFSKESNGLLSDDGRQLKVSEHLDNARSPALTKILYFDKQAYTVYLKKRKRYDRLKEENSSEFANKKLKKAFSRSKKMSHAIRLIEMAMEIASGKGMHVKRSNGHYLKAIKEGVIPDDYIIKRITWEALNMNKRFRASRLPEHPKKGLINRFLTQIVQKQLKLKYESK